MNIRIRLPRTGGAAALLLVVPLLLAGCAEKVTPVETGGNGSGAGAPAARAPADPAPELEAALARASAEKKNVLVEWTSTECRYCDQMNEETLADAGVTQALSEKVVHVRIVKEENGKAFTSRFGSAPTPTFVVLSPDGKTVGQRVSGVVATDDFLRLVDWAAKGEGTQPGVKTGGT